MIDEPQMVEFHEGIALQQRICIRPNRSMTDAQALGLAALIGLGCLAVATLLALQGYWVPLPFAGAEALGLVAATWWVRRRLARQETIEVTPSELALTRQTGNAQTREVLQTGWVRIELRPGRYRWYPRRLVVSAKGCEHEIGSFLADRERRLLAERLRELTRPYSMWATS